MNTCVQIKCVNFMFVQDMELEQGLRHQVSFGCTCSCVLKYSDPPTEHR